MKLNTNKRDVSDGLASDNFRYACGKLFVHVASLLCSILTHGSVPDNFLTDTIPTPQNKNVNITKSDNY